MGRGGVGSGEYEEQGKQRGKGAKRVLSWKRGARCFDSRLTSESY